MNKLIVFWILAQNLNFNLLDFYCKDHTIFKEVQMNNSIRKNLDLPDNEV